MRILAVSNHYPPFHAGGYGVLCHRLCELLRSGGHEVMVLTSAPTTGEPDPGGHEVSVQVQRSLAFVVARRNPASLLWRTWRNRRAVLRAIRAFGPDLVYCFGIDGVGYQVYHTAVESGVRSVTVVGDTWLAQAWRDLSKFDPWTGLAAGRNSTGTTRRVKQMVGWWGSLAGLYTGRKPLSAHPVYALSTFLMEDLKHAGMPWSAQCRLLAYPLAAPFVARDGEPAGRGGTRTRGLRALFLSRMELLKGPDLAIRGVALAAQQGADVRLTLCGIGADRLRGELDRLARSLGIGDRVAWAQAPTDEALVALYRAHDVLVFPSRILEGLGIVCVEAMACGLPVLATAMGGQLDVVKHGETGFTFSAGDVETLGAQLARLAGDPALLETLSRGAVDMARRFSPAAIRANLERWNRDAMAP